MKVIHEILNKEKKNNYLVTFRGKQIKLSLCDDGYTDSSAYYSLKTKQNKTNKDDPNFLNSHFLAQNNKNSNNDRQNDEHKHQSKLNLYPSFSHSAPNDLMSINRNESKDDKKNDSMQLLVLRLKSLIENTIQTQKSLQSKLKVLSLIDNGLTKTDQNHKKSNSNHKDDEKKNNSDSDNVSDENENIDIDVAFGDESYTIDAMKESLETLKNDKNQIQVYKQALTAFETVCFVSCSNIFCIYCFCFNMLKQC